MSSKANVIITVGCTIEILKNSKLVAESLVLARDFSITKTQVKAKIITKYFFHIISVKQKIVYTLLLPNNRH